MELKKRGFFGSIARWFDAYADNDNASAGGDAAQRFDLTRLIPFIALHLGCFAVIWVGVSATAVAVAVFLYVLRMFAITAFYHRYFSHGAFRASRAAQFLFAVLGAAGVQRGPLWWASQHRHHHVSADGPHDAHSPLQHGFLWSHMGWFLSRENFATRSELVKDLTRYPELRFLDRYDAVVPLALALSLYGLGEILAAAMPELATSGAQLLVWGFCISTVVLYQATFTVNSMAHGFGRRRYATGDDSRNNVWLALLTLGEGWHNNHHHYPGAARQGFYWWEIDITYYGLKLLETFGVIRDLRPVPARMLAARRVVKAVS